MITAGTSFAAGLAGAVLMGMSCGTGCSPAISLFLSGYIVHTEGDTKAFAGSFIRFFIGKTLSVLLVCTAAALLGTALIGDAGYFGQYRLKYLMPSFLILTGAYLLYKCLNEIRHKEGCGNCAGHCRSGRWRSFIGASPLIGGFFYGLTPCPPLILLAGYAVALPLAQALVIGTAFSAACMVSPLLLMLVLMKLIVVKMKQESPGVMQAAKVIVSAMVLIIGIVSCFTGLEPQILP